MLQDVILYPWVYVQHTLGLLGYLMNKMGRNLGGAEEKEMELGGEKKVSWGYMCSWVINYAQINTL